MTLSFTGVLACFTAMMVFPFFSQAADYPEELGRPPMGSPLHAGRIPTDPVWVLSIDGGGIKGLIPATILAYIESQVNIRLDSYWRERISESAGSPYNREIPSSFKTGSFFDLLAGTSTGGIIALGLACRHPKDPLQPLYQASDLANLYKKNGSTIFPSPSLGSGIASVFSPKYDAHPLEGLFQDYFRDARLKDAIRPLIITGYEMRQERLHLFDSLKAQRDEAEDYFVKDVARATSAAPTFFNAAVIFNARKEERMMADGGIIANNPSMAAYTKAREIFPQASSIHLLSIGTGVTTQDDLSSHGTSGLLGWGPKIASVMMDGTSGFTHHLLSRMASSPDFRYLRLQPTITKKRGEMDVTDDNNMAYLEAIANKFIAESPDLNLWIEEITNACKTRECFFPGLVSEVKRQLQKDSSRLVLPGKEINDLKVWQVSSLLSFLPGAVQALKFLDLQDNDLTQDGLMHLRVLTGLEGLNLSNNRKLTAEIAHLIASSFPNLTTLFVNRIPLGADGVITLAETLRNLTTFHAASTHKGDGAINTITTSLTSLTDINLSRNGLSPEGVTRILGIPSLQSVALGNRGTLLAIMSNLPHSLKELALDHMDLNASAQIERLGERVPNLLSLDLRFNAFKADSGQGLGEIINHLTNLQTLTLSNNNLQDEGIRHLVANLANHPSLTHLSVDRNGLGLEGAGALFTSLQSLKSLKFLNIQHNAVSQEQCADYRRLCTTFQRQKPFVSLVWEG